MNEDAAGPKLTWATGVMTMVVDGANQGFATLDQALGVGKAVAACFEGEERDRVYSIFRDALMGGSK